MRSDDRPFVHIRVPATQLPLCDDLCAYQAQSISWRHARTQPVHMATLNMCKHCLRVFMQMGVRREP